MHFFITLTRAVLRLEMCSFPRQAANLFGKRPPMA
jgi:hypothetical protein